MIDPLSLTDTHLRWRDALFVRLRDRPLPLVWTADALVPAASLWAGARRWTHALRARGLGPGDRLVCALPPGPAFVMVLVAALWDGLTFVPVPPAADARATLALVDARIAVVPEARGDDPRLVAAQPAGTPPDAHPAAPAARGAPTPDARFLLQTSGTTGARRWIALSDANVRAVLESHAPHLGLDGAVLLSVLPWHHAFGLVIELLPALLAGAELIRDPSAGRDAAAMLVVARAHGVTHLHAVPRTVRLLAEHPEGEAVLRALSGGVIGGAPADEALARVLSRTRLRVGYGQTEAAPGIALGDPGAWRAGTLGRPLGCDVRLDDDGVLAFRGANACLGEWRDGALVHLAPDRWVHTGDLARAERDGTYTFEGRRAASFKLANGRFVAADAIERAVRARFPALREVLLSSADGESLSLACTPADDASPLPAPADVAPLLGALATRPLRVVAVADARWVRTPKGELDRRFPLGRDPRG
ncbi:MAG: class I adenylate-forming enzyme family protein [Gemmatirosa sp.]